MISVRYNQRMAELAFDLEHHLAQEHTVSPLSKYLKEIVYGGTDGIVTTFAVVAGFAGAGSNPTSNLPVLSVLLFGFANLFADGISMALGNFLSTRSEQDVYKKEKAKEQKEITTNKEIEREESEVILVKKGFTQEQAKTLVSIYATNEPYWLEFMMNDELELPNPEGANATMMAAITCVSFIGFGLTPLIPYVLFRDSPDVFLYSIIAAAGAMSFLGLMRWKVTKQHAAQSIGETLFLGGIAAAVAYLVGTFFQI